MTKRHGLAALGIEPLFEFAPVGTGIRARNQNGANIPVFDAKAGVLESQLVVFGVFLPQQLQGDPGAFEFLVHAGKVRGELFAVTR